ncbi:MAG TPA: lysylphosphatidylglycerol synthase domain-containing protein [Solirubrobacteraceae bacterium]|nr:lysylphosphatidylglycerol synthase domain-containing protein [Solirubrobacteraceae bacterium]
MAPGALNPFVQEHHVRRALRNARRHLLRSALKLAGYLAAAYLVLKLIPALKQALHNLEHVSWEWALGAIVLEVLSEFGFVLAWRAIIDPQKLLAGDGRGQRMDDDVAWTQLAGGLLLPGGAWGGVGVGAFILHRFGMPNKLIAEREFNLSFLNTAVDALVLIIVGVGLAIGIFAGEHHLLLTVLPAAVAAAGIAVALLIAHRASSRAMRLQAKHPKIASAITTLADAVDDTERLLLHRGAWISVLGVLAYFGLDVLVLWTAFLAIHANPAPEIAVVVMAYIIGALGGSIPLPASAGTVGGIGGMLILYKVGHNVAIAAVLLHQAIGLLVPLAGGGIAYAILRHRFGPITRRTSIGDSEA